MATHKLSVIIVFIATVAAMASSVSATEWTVGDDQGWTFGYDYQAWADGKEFTVGDKLIFKYPAGKHNVFEVDENGYKNCVVPPANEALTGGCDVVNLETPGKKWYLCGVGQHCEVGRMKLAINVLPHLIPAGASTGKELVVGDEKGWTMNVNYRAWAGGKEFNVGDKLIFKYPLGKHNVFKVTESAFRECNIPPANEALASGHDAVTLTTPGGNFFICGVGKHCEMGMKLSVDVLQSQAASKQPPGGLARKLVPPKL